MDLDMPLEDPTTEEDFKKFEMKVDKVYKMLEELTCADKGKVKDAEAKIDKFLEENKTEQEAAHKEVKVRNDRTVINKDKNADNVKKANELKELGNEAFRQSDFQKAVEYYTSAVMAKDDNPILYTNRAQALLKLGRYLEASHDCRQAIKLKPDLIKAYIHLSKGLKEMGEFQEAIDILEKAEDVSEEQANVVKKYKMDMIQEQKKAFLELDGGK